MSRQIYLLERNISLRIRTKSVNNFEVKNNTKSGMPYLSPIRVSIL